MSGPTLQSVADLAGLSLMSASRALSGGQVSPENAARVKAAAEALGYVPNVAARRMRGGRTNTVGVLINADLDPHMEIMSILDCLIREMEEAGKQVLLSVARGGSAQIDMHLEGFLARGVDGVFFQNAQPSRLLERYRQAEVPVVAISHRDDGCPELPFVTHDAEAVFAQMYQRLTDLGHRVAVEFTRGGTPPMHEKFRSFGELRWRRCDLGSDRTVMLAHVRTELASPDPPTLFMADYPGAVELLSVCEELRVPVPEKLSVVSTVDGLSAPMLRTPLSSLRADYELFGRAAARSMLAALEGEEIEDVLVPGGMEWIERSSTGPVPEPDGVSAR
ncbi:LacI family DNA-binding transcriptional regulator [Pseudonocardia benzenivorans]